MTDQQKSKIKENVPLVALIIVVICALIVLGLILLAKPVNHENLNLTNNANEQLNQTSNASLLLPIKNVTPRSMQPVNINFDFLTPDKTTNDQPISLDQTYTNSDYKFSISYPKEYLAQENAQPVEAVFSVSFVTFSEDLPKVTLYEDRTLSSEIENALAQNISSSIEIEKKKFTSIEATLITTPLVNAVETSLNKRIIWEYNNYLFELTGVQSENLINEMLNSFVATGE